jgi:hypothetical protein
LIDRRPFCREAGAGLDESDAMISKLCGYRRDDFALFLACQPDETVVDCLLLLERKLDCEMRCIADRAEVIDQFFDAILMRVRQIERTAVRGSQLLN